MVAQARQGLACSGSAAEANLPKKPTSPQHLRGRVISPKAPRPQTQTAAAAPDGPRDSSPTEEVAAERGGDGSESAGLGFLPWWLGVF